MKRYTANLIQNVTSLGHSLADNQDLELLLTQAAAGGYTITWAGVDTWLTPSGNPPVLKTAVGASDLIILSKTGSKVYGIHQAETGPAGAAGNPGAVGVTWRGVYSSGATYAARDVAYYNGSSYIALQTAVAQQPDIAPAYWAAFASGGGTGGGGGGGGTDYVDNFTRSNTAQRVATCGTTNASPTVTDTAITAGEQGRAVTGTGIPASSFVGTVTAGVSFLLSSSATTQVDVNATATGSPSLTFAVMTISYNAPWTYTSLTGSGLEILANKLHDSNSSGGQQRYRAEQVMSSVDHHAQITLATFTTASSVSVQAGVMCRYDSAADTFYRASILPFGATQFKVTIHRFNAAAATQLVEGAAIAAPVAGDTVKLTVAGSVVTAYLNGGEQCQITDSTPLTTGVRSGVHMHRASGAVDVAISELRFGV